MGQRRKGDDELGGRMDIYTQGVSLWLGWERICLQCGRPRFDPWVGKIPWRRARELTPVSLPGESPWIEEPGWLQSMGSQRVRHN